MTDVAPATRHLSLKQLEAGLDEIRRSPTDHGVIELIVCRPLVESRRVVAEAELRAGEGLVGDCWRTRGSTSTDDGAANPQAEITVMNARAISVIAGDRGNWPMAGDQFYVDLDLSPGNLPAGTRLELGTALLEVTPLPHLGCGKFLKRFGTDAAKFVNSGAGRDLNLRGINARIVRDGTVRTGDAIVKLTV